MIRLTRKNITRKGLLRELATSPRTAESLTERLTGYALPKHLDRVKRLLSGMIGRGEVKRTEKGFALAVSAKKKRS